MLKSTDPTGYNEEDLDKWFDEQDAEMAIIFADATGSSQWDPTGLPRAKNVVDWITNPIYLNRTTLYDYPRQYQILRDYHELLCPHCNKLWEVRDCWDRTLYDMQHDILLEYGVCPKCGTTRAQLLEDGFIEDVEEVILLMGMRSGKTTMIGTFDQTFTAHRYLCLKDPIAYFGLDRSVTLEAGFFASSWEQTEQTVWAYFLSTMISCDWYTMYLSSLRGFSDKRRIPWQSMYLQLKTKIRIAPQRLQFAAYGRNIKGTAGRTRFSAVVDEMGMFQYSGSDEVYSIPAASLKTLRASADKLTKEGDPDVPPVRLTELGSPGPDPTLDPLENRYTVTSTKSIPRVYGVRYATWAANKHITRESLEADFQTNPVKAQQQWGAKAVAYAVKFFPTHLTSSAFREYEQAGFYWTPLVRPLTSPDGTRLYYIEAHMDQLNLGMTDGPLIIVGDAGKSKDRFALAAARVLGSGSSMRIRIEAIVQLVPSVIQSPDGETNTEVYYGCVVPIIKRLHEMTGVALVVFDRWDSTSIVQTLRESGIPAYQENTCTDDYDMARGEFRAGRVEIPSRCPVNQGFVYAALQKELDELRQTDNGRVDHPKGMQYHNDVVQVVCKAIAASVNLPEHLKRARKASGILSIERRLPAGRVATFSHGAAGMRKQRIAPQGAGEPPSHLRMMRQMPKRPR